MSTRFTLDGSPELESRLARLCDEVRLAVQATVPAHELQAVVLGGGYGRGEGGVLKADDGDHPYNDLEFYLFLKRHPLVQRLRFGAPLHARAHCLSVQAGLDIEFKIDSLAQLRRRPVTLFSYDLVAGHRIVFGPDTLFEGCEHHLRAERIPLEEATRLLWNRCSGLLLSAQRLRHEEFTAHDADFVGRNIAKAQQAIGDALLIALGRYDWSILERRQRLAEIAPGDNVPCLDAVRKHFDAGFDFKLHPRRSRKAAEEFIREHREISLLARRFWLWIESRRLHRDFASTRDYAFSHATKCPGRPAWRNRLLNLRTFGLQGALDSLAGRYPRERLFNALSLLLWHDGTLIDPLVNRLLQEQLCAPASDWEGFVSAYTRAWPEYG